MKDNTPLIIGAVGVGLLLFWPKSAAAATVPGTVPSNTSLITQLLAALKPSSSSGGGGFSAGGGGSPSGGGGVSQQLLSSGGSGPTSATPIFGPQNPTVPYNPVLTSSGTYAQTPGGSYVTVDANGDYVDEYGDVIDPSTLQDSGNYANAPADYGIIDMDIVGYDYVGGTDLTTTAGGGGPDDSSDMSSDPSFADDTEYT